MWLLINNKHENNFEMAKQKKRTRITQLGKIAPSWARAWFEAKDLIGPDQTLLFINQS